MSRIKVKICGLTRYDDLRGSIDAGADAVGFVVESPDSPRNLPLGKASELARLTPASVLKVAVTVSDDEDKLVEVVEKVGPSALQTHGAPVPVISKVKRLFPSLSIIRAINVRDQDSRHIANAYAESADMLLLDSGPRYGGTGETHDWYLSREIRMEVAPKPVILAGGLNHQNVQQAIRIVKPYAVDVSSGVEVRRGEKDILKIRLFIERAKGMEI